MSRILAVEYTCSNCGAKQTIRYFSDDSILPVTCCVKCRAGFEVRSELPSQAVNYMVNKNIGMFPGAPVQEEDAYQSKSTAKRIAAMSAGAS